MRGFYIIENVSYFIYILCFSHLEHKTSSIVEQKSNTQYTLICLITWMVGSELNLPRAIGSSSATENQATQKVEETGTIPQRKVKKVVRCQESSARQID
jgi:hypothetical protein